MSSHRHNERAWEATTPRTPPAPPWIFPHLDRESQAGRLLQRILPDVAASMAALPEPSTCLAEELIDLSTYWLTLLSRLVHRVATGDAVARYEEEEIERLMPSDAMMDVRPVDALNDKINALKCMAGMLVQCQERCQKTWDGTNFHRPPPATPNDPTDAPRPANTDLALSVVNQSSQRPTLPLLPASPPIPTIISPQAVTTTRSFVEDDVDDDRDDNEAEEIVLRALEQLGTARGKGRHACPLGTACHKDGWDAHGQPRIFKQNGAYREHLHKHVRPKKCPVPGCSNTKGFVRQGNLDRHMRDIHRIPPA